MFAAHARLDRKVRSEAKALLRDSKLILRRYAYKIPDSARMEIRASVDALQQAYDEREHDGTRLQLFVLGELADEHLSFARKSTVREYTESIGIAVLIALFLRGFVVEAFKIPSGSMIPTLQIGDHIFVNKLVYGIRIPYTESHLVTFRGPKRGEVVVFINPCEPDKDFIKRIVALAGDTVEVRCDALFVNGQRVQYEQIDPDNTCGYWDYDEREGWSTEPRPCSAYRETLDGKSYTTLQSESRPSQERRWRNSPYAVVRNFDNQDFPVDGQRPSCVTGYAYDPGSSRGALVDVLAVAERRGLISYDQRRLAESSAGVGEVVERHVDDPSLPAGCRQSEHYVVPEGHVFAMGDNRANSSDSRKWGPVPVENIKGKAMFIWWSRRPPEQGGSTPFGAIWDRMGKVVH